MEFDWLGFRIGFNSQPISNSNKIMDLKEKPQKQVPLRLNRANYCPTSLLTDPTRQLHHHVKFSRDLGWFEFHTPPCLALTLWKHNLDFYLMSSYTYIYVCIQCIYISYSIHQSYETWGIRLHSCVMLDPIGTSENRSRCWLRWAKCSSVGCVFC